MNALYKINLWPILRSYCKRSIFVIFHFFKFLPYNDYNDYGDRDIESDLVNRWLSDTVGYYLQNLNHDIEG